MTYSIKIDWNEELQKVDLWENVGRRVLEANCQHKDQDKSKNKETNIRYAGYCEKCEVSEDTAIPMMNFGYPLESAPDDEKVLEVLHKTCCTVLYNTDTDTFYLALCGGGMDLSQDIALAYHLLEQWIPYDLAVRVCTQKDLSVGGKDWEVLQKSMQENLKHYRDNAERKLQEWGEYAG